MDFTKFFVFYIFYTLLAILGIMGEDEEICEIPPQEAELLFDKDKINIVVYMNGEAARDLVWIDQYEKLLVEGFPYETYAPTTIKIGGNIVCDQNNVCTCPSSKENTVDNCEATFKHVCVAQNLSGDFHWNFLFCMRRDSFDACVARYNGLAAKIKTCMDKKGDDGGAKDLALAIAQEVIDNGVNIERIPGPYFFFDENFNKCINGVVYKAWMSTICAMLKDEIAKSLQFCKQV